MSGLSRASFAGTPARSQPAQTHANGPDGTLFVQGCERAKLGCRSELGAGDWGKSAAPVRPQSSQIRLCRHRKLFLLLGQLGDMLRPDILHELHCRNALVEKRHHIKKHIDLRAAEILCVWLMERERLSHRCVGDKRTLHRLLYCDRELDFRLHHARAFAKQPAPMLLVAKPLPVRAGKADATGGKGQPASMGPRLLSRGKKNKNSPRTASSSLQWGRDFSAAEMSVHVGVPILLACKQSECKVRSTESAGCLRAAGV